MMKQDAFLNPTLSVDSVDTYIMRTALLNAIKNSLPSLSGTLLDVGCGEMPYREFILETSRVQRYIGLDVRKATDQAGRHPDLFWNGAHIPLADGSIDSAIATELFDTLPDLDVVLREICRVLKPGGTLFFMVPFVWPLQGRRYTPVSLRQHLEGSEFDVRSITALGGWNASLAQMIGLWLNRSGLTPDDRRQFFTELTPLYEELVRSDSVPAETKDQTMSPGFQGMAVKRARAADVPLISVCIPTYNRSAYIGECLRSVLDQADERCEIIVVDDGSTDNTEQIVRHLGRPEIRYVKKAHTNGSDTRNRAIAEATGDYILWVDSDDLLLPGAIRKHRTAMRTHPEADVLYGNLKIFGDTRRLPAAQILYEDFGRRSDHLLSLLVSSCPIPHQGTVVRKSLYDRVGPYDPEFIRAHDHEFWCRAVAEATFTHVGGYTCLWRWHDTNLSSGSVAIDTRFEARLLKKLTRDHSIEELFPFIDWTDRNSSRIFAYFQVAKAFINWRDTEEAFAWIERAVGIINPGWRMPQGPDEQKWKMVELLVRETFKDDLQTRSEFDHGIDALRRRKAAAPASTAFDRTFYENKLARLGARLKAQPGDIATTEQLKAELLLKTLPRATAAATPLVSVVIPFYRQSDTIAATLDSLAAQTYRRFEILIVSDGDPAFPERVVEQFRGEHPDIPVVCEVKPHSGLAATRNWAIERAQGAYILPLDADDLIASVFLEKAVAVLESDASLGFAYTDTLCFGEKNEIWIHPDFNSRRLLQHNLMTCTTLFRRDLWASVGGYNVNMQHIYEDWDFWIGAVEHGFRAAHIPLPLFIYRKKKQSMIAGAQQHEGLAKTQIIVNHPSLYQPLTADRRKVLDAAPVGVIPESLLRPPIHTEAGSQNRTLDPAPEFTCTEDVLRSLRGRIAIVGNATPKGELATLIDAFDVVVRLNNFELSGFERLVGRKTSYRCTSGWQDIEPRDEHLEFSPFTATTPESSHIPLYEQRCQRPLLTARTNVHVLHPGIAKPSTGFALVALCSHLAIPVEVFAFDGFKTPHYWSGHDTFHTTHSGDEFAVMCGLPHVTVHTGPFHIKPGYISRDTPEYFEDSVTDKTGDVWQPDVYRLAALVARRLGCDRIIDVGCGRAQKLAALYPEFSITGVDYGDNIRFCRQQHRFGQWIEADLEQPFTVKAPPARLRRSVVVCSDVIEHLIDPTALLRTLRDLVRHAPAVILSTPERDRTRGMDDPGPPKNRAHVREWNLRELESLLKAAGFTVNFIGLTRSNTNSNEMNTTVAVLTPASATGLLEAGNTGQAIVIEGESVRFRDADDTRVPAPTPRTHQKMVSFIVPLRGRTEHLDGFIHTIERTYADIPYEVILVEQADDLLFKRGQLCNLGFKKSQGDIVVFQDIDTRYLEPIDFEHHLNRLGRPYAGYDTIAHIQEPRVGEYVVTETEPRPWGYGACAVFSREQFKACHGFSNLIVGWGGEDDVIAARARMERLACTLAHVTHDQLPRNEVTNTAWHKQNVFFMQTDHSRNHSKDSFRQTMATEISCGPLRDRANFTIYRYKDISVPDDFVYKLHLRNREAGEVSQLVSAQQTDGADELTRLLATVITPNSSVLDVSAGAKTLARHLPAGCEYLPIDVAPSRADTLFADLGAGRLANLPHAYDYVISNGVMEYVRPVGYFLNQVARWGRTVILAYPTTDLTPDFASRQRSGWANHLSGRELTRQFRRQGLRVTSRTRWRELDIFVLDPAAARQLMHFDRAVAPRPDIQSVCRLDATNAGDFHSAPFRYVDLGTLRCSDIITLPRPNELARQLVIGGGGLLGSPSFEPFWQQLFSRSYDTVVGWGMGDNARVDTTSGFVDRTECVYPDYVRRFDLLGVRDIGTPYEWVPCASCLHPLFDEEWPIEHDVVVFEHKRVPTGIEEFPKMNNDTNDLARVLRFLGSGRVVITNSYHGAYWAQLLGRGVLAFPFSSKFYHLRHKATLCRPHEWKQHLDRVEDQPPALQECIDANLRFARKVAARLDLASVPVPTASQPEHPPATTLRPAAYASVLPLSLGEQAAGAMSELR